MTSSGFKRESWAEDLDIVRKLVVFKTVRLDMNMKGNACRNRRERITFLRNLQHQEFREKGKT